MFSGGMSLELVDIEVDEGVVSERVEWEVHEGPHMLAQTLNQENYHDSGKNKDDFDQFCQE